MWNDQRVWVERQKMESDSKNADPTSPTMCTKTSPKEGESWPPKMRISITNGDLSLLRIEAMNVLNWLLEDMIWKLGSIYLIYQGLIQTSNSTWYQFGTASGFFIFFRRPFQIQSAVCWAHPSGAELFSSPKASGGPRKKECSRRACRVCPSLSRANLGHRKRLIWKQNCFRLSSCMGYGI